MNDKHIRDCRLFLLGASVKTKNVSWKSSTHFKVFNNSDPNSKKLKTALATPSSSRSHAFKVVSFFLCYLCYIGISFLFQMFAFLLVVNQ